MDDFAVEIREAHLIVPRDLDCQNKNNQEEKVGRSEERQKVERHKPPWVWQHLNLSK